MFKCFLPSLLPLLLSTAYLKRFKEEQNDIKFFLNFLPNVSTLQKKLKTQWKCPGSPSPEGSSSRATTVHSLSSQFLIGTSHITQCHCLLIFILRRAGINRLLAEGKVPRKNHILSHLDYKKLIARCIFLHPLL